MPKLATLDELKRRAEEAQKKYEEAQRAERERQKKETEKRLRQHGIMIENAWAGGRKIPPEALREILAEIAKNKILLNGIEATLKKFGCLPAAEKNDPAAPAQPGNMED